MPDLLSTGLAFNGRGPLSCHFFITAAHHFPPNFLPPYDTEEKRQIILSYLTEEWDEKILSWKKAQYVERKEVRVAGTCDKIGLEWCGVSGNPIESLLCGRGGSASEKPAEVYVPTAAAAETTMKVPF